jgi:hypothetical protein
MNCPSRTDDTLEHDEWNQNPPLLAPDLTTCQDFNGIVNARENEDAKRGASGLHGGIKWEDVTPFKEPEKGDFLPSGRGMSLTLSGTDSSFPAMSSSANHASRTFRSIQFWPAG